MEQCGEGEGRGSTVEVFLKQKGEFPQEKLKSIRSVQFTIKDSNLCQLTLQALGDVCVMWVLKSNVQTLLGHPLTYRPIWSKKKNNTVEKRLQHVTNTESEEVTQWENTRKCQLASLFEACRAQQLQVLPLLIKSFSH